MTLAAELKRIRNTAGLTMVAFGERLGVSKSYIAQLEAGERETISFEFAAKICTAFGLPMDHFVPILAPGITVPPPPAQEHRCQLVGTIAAGPDDVPIVYDEPEWIAFDGPLPNGTFALRVTGHSCTRWGICDGDVVPVAPTTTPMENGFHALRSSGGDHTLNSYARGKWWQFRPGDAEPVEYHFTDSTRLFGLVVDKRYGKRVFSPTATEPVKKPRKKGK